MNARQIDEIHARARAEVQEPLDRQLAPLGRLAMAALEPRPGEAILDIGCGAGHTTLQLAELVGPQGFVCGVDISPHMLEIARRRAAASPHVRFVDADAQTFPFGPGAFDAAYSRFGVMFFADPTAAFANIRHGLKREGRLSFVCWRALAENELDAFALRAAAGRIPPQPPVDAGAPGPFSFSDPDLVVRVLSSAGFQQIRVEPHDTQVGAEDLQTMLALCLRVGSLGKILRENPRLRSAAEPAVRDALAARLAPGGVTLNAATWVVTAQARADLAK